jgi:hypothetical protein
MNYEQLQLKEYLSILGIALGGNNESINNNKFHKTNPISKKPKMKLSLYLTKDYGNESMPSNSEKQTQSNPIFTVAISAFAQALPSTIGLSFGAAQRILTACIYDKSCGESAYRRMQSLRIAEPHSKISHQAA